MLEGSQMPHRPGALGHLAAFLLAGDEGWGLIPQVGCAPALSPRVLLCGYLCALVRLGDLSLSFVQGPSGMYVSVFLGCGWCPGPSQQPVEDILLGNSWP